MTFDVDTALRRIADAEHPRLGGIDDAVFSRVRNNRASARAGIGAASLAAFGAVILGTMAAGPTATPAVAPPLDPFGVTSPLAPSTLLLADR